MKRNKQQRCHSPAVAQDSTFAESQALCSGCSLSGACDRSFARCPAAVHQPRQRKKREPKQKQRLRQFQCSMDEEPAPAPLRRMKISLTASDDANSTLRTAPTSFL